jgi:hypothetical protein
MMIQHILHRRTHRVQLRGRSVPRHLLRQPTLHLSEIPAVRKRPVAELYLREFTISSTQPNFAAMFSLCDLMHCVTLLLVHSIMPLVAGS